MDNFIVSARKYRPVTFKQVVGQQSITSTLQNAIKNNHLAQAFLFTGPRGVGKTTCARILAKTINCTHLNEQLEPCDQCESCRSFNSSSSFNIHELDAASNNSVDDIRSLVEQVRIPPQVGKYKVYIIDEVHMLSQAAFNAFLKTLEEPPAYAKFILATTEKHKIIPTILSRCQIFDFRRIMVEDIAQYLDYVAASEHIETEPEALHIIAQKADGALRDALSTFDQIVSYSGNKLTYKSVIENLNILDYEYYFRVTDNILRNEVPALLLIFNEVIENGFDGQHFIMGLADHLRSLLVIKNPETIQLMYASDQLKERYKVQASYCSPDFLLKALDICSQYDIKYKASSNKRLHVEISLMLLSELMNKQPKVEAKPLPPVTKTNPTKTPASETKPSYLTSPPVEKKESLKTVAEPVKSIDTTPTLKTITQAEKAEDHSADVELKKTMTAESNKPEVATTGKAIKSISIKRTLQAMKEKSEAEGAAPEPIIDNPFTQEQLEQAWKDFCKKYVESSPSFANGLSKYTPTLGENRKITYKVDSLLISQDLLAVNSLMEFLKIELKNNQITLHPVLPDKNEQKKAYTDKEKLERLTEKYPKVKKLKDQLNLEIGF